MQFALTFVRGKPVKGADILNKYLKNLNGNYIFDINEENNLTNTAECRAAYFFKVDLVAKTTGEERYDIHERFKNKYNIGTTRNLSVVDWRNLIKQFQNYIFEELDILI